MMIYPALRIEVSYSSTLIALWALILAVLSWIASFPMQGLSILFLSSVALTSPHGESRMLFPLLFLAERLLDDVMSLGHAPLEFYASTLLSYLTLVVCRGERRGNENRNIYLEAIMYAVVGLVVVFFICKDSVISVGAGVFVLAGFAFFLGLRSVLGENEAVLVGSLVGFYICDVVINSGAAGGEEILHAPGYFTTKTHIASRGAVLCAIYLSIVMYVGSRYCMVPRVNNSKSSERDISVQRITALFWCSLTSIVAVVHAAVSFQFKENALLWIWHYITSSSFRVRVLMAWATVIPISVVAVHKFTTKLRSTARRKLFHFLAVVAFTPVALVDPQFLSLALSVATSLSVIVELARSYRVCGSHTVDAFIASHIDGRETINGAVRTHIYLIYGLGLSMMLRYRHEQPKTVMQLPREMGLSLNIIPGIVSLGVVDACAGIVGSTFLIPYRRALGRYLNNKFYTERANASITHKTTTGTAAGLLCGASFWLFILLITQAVVERAAAYTYFLILLCSVTECFMDGIDNLQLPLVVDGVAQTLFVILIRSSNLWK
ncbi:dolichol kinase [Trypanosoma grayi]|uniref:dolichol kinase n=1 Tax=Trypanosoma grayi TaxID=71804 RepID=UPI0004F428A6|nr:dolichol kinase [Trypanosoma grayi]KEG15196.1 dolichol kinase [Trypanosoma grayi]